MFITLKVMANSVGILHFAGPPVVGGVESTIYHHSRLLAQLGYPVTVIAGRGEPFYPQVKFVHISEINSRNEKVLRVGRSLADGQVGEGFEALRDELVSKLTPILQEIDVCMVHNAVTLHKNLALTAALWQMSSSEDTRLIAWCHDFAWRDQIYASDLHPGYPWDLLRTPWSGVRYVVVSSSRQVQLADLLDLPKSQIQVVTPGIDIARFLKLEPLTQRLVSKLDLLDADPLILLPARITRRKNIQFAIRVMAQLKVTHPHAILLVTGPPGPHNPKNIAYLQSLKNLRQELGLKQNVYFLHEQGEEDTGLYVPDETIADLYHLADLLLFPSHREGFGIPVLEAGLTRLPVFAADIGPIEGSVGDLGTLFNPDGDPAEVSEAIAGHLATSEAYQLKRRVLTQYTWQSIVRYKLVPLLQGDRPDN